MSSLCKVVLGMMFVLALITSCASDEPTSTPVPPTSTPLPPTASATPVPPTSTPLPPTASATAIPPTASATATPVVFFSLEKGPQSFPRWSTFQIGLGDLDGDGDLDAVFSNMQSDPATVWLNDGAGHFTDSGQRLTDWAHGVGIGDLDGDGDLDLFITCADYGRASKVYLNDGNGVFQDSGQDMGDTDLSGTSVDLADIDADGDLDAMIVRYQHANSVYLNDGAGAFTASLMTFPTASAWGDLDSDGDVDHFYKQDGIGYGCMLNDGEGNFVQHWVYEDTAALMFGDIALGDVDNDGDLDAIVADGDWDASANPTLVFLNDGAGRFVDSGQRLSAMRGASVSLGDLDGDAYVDLVLIDLGEPTQIWINDGAGQFIDSGFRFGEGEFFRHASLGDLDQDGDLDAFLANYPPRSRPSEIWFNALANAGPASGRETIHAENVSQIESVAVFDLSWPLIHSVFFTPDGRYLVAADTNGEVIFWQVGAWKEYARFTTQGDIMTMAMSPDGEMLVTAGEAGEVKAWDREGNELFSFAYGGRAFCAAFSPDGRYLAVGGENDNVLILDVQAREKVTDLISDHHYVSNLVFFPDGERLLVSYERDANVMKIWDTSTWTETSTFSHVTERIDYHDTVFSPDGAYLAVASTQNPIKFLDVETGQVAAQFVGHTRGTYRVAFSPDGSLLASAADDMTLRLWNVESGDVLKRLDYEHEVGVVAFSPDGTLLAFGVWEDGVEVWAVSGAEGSLPH